jgi:hypothetical protein
VIVNGCIGKIIARDLSLVASRLYRMAVTRPQSRVAVTQQWQIQLGPTRTQEHIQVLLFKCNQSEGAKQFGRQPKLNVLSSGGKGSDAPVLANNHTELMVPQTALGKVRFEQ